MSDSPKNSGLWYEIGRLAGDLDLAASRIAELEAENKRLTDVLRKINALVEREERNLPPHGFNIRSTDLRRILDRITAGDSPGCTGLTAAWCPVHGDCTCPERAEPDHALDDPGCPLHAPLSPHAEDHA